MIRASTVAIACVFAFPVTAEEVSPTDEPSAIDPPRVLVFAHKLWGPPEEIPDNIEDKNPHAVLVYFFPVPEEKHEVARYTVIPGERESPELVCADWENYHFHIRVKIPTNAWVRIFKDGEPLLDVQTAMHFQPPPRDPMDPEVLRDRLERAEERNKVNWEIRHRTNTVVFHQSKDHWLDANCTLEANEWGYTNEWIVRELDADIIKAQYPIGIDDNSDTRAEEFFAQWQPGDRLFSYGTPRHLQGPVSGEWGYLIVRECRIVAKLMVIIS